MNKYNLKTTSYLCKNIRKEINNNNDSKDISSNDQDNDENNRDKNINNIFAKNSLGNYFKKIYNIPYIPNFQNTRTKRQIVPFLNKASLKKRKNIQDIINPLFLKETSQKYIDKRTTVTESNFYKNNQHIFNSLLDESTPRSKDKDKLRNKSLIMNQNEKLMLNDMKYAAYIKNRLIPSYDNNKYDCSFKYIRKNENNTPIVLNNNNVNCGIIDFLFLDNWEEKTQFERKYFKNI